MTTGGDFRRWSWMESQSFSGAGMFWSSSLQGHRASLLRLWPLGFFVRLQSRRQRRVTSGEDLHRWPTGDNHSGVVLQKRLQLKVTNSRAASSNHCFYCLQPEHNNTVTRLFDSSSSQNAVKAENDDSSDENEQLCIDFKINLINFLLSRDQDF